MDGRRQGTGRRRVSRGLIGLLVISALIALGAPAGAGVDDQSKVGRDVRVVNTPAEPVPVSGTVSVANLPAVQPVAGTVNVGNLPAVQAVRSQPTPFQFSGTDSILGPNIDGGSTIYSRNWDVDVPDGKTFVIEYVHIWVLVTHPDTLVNGPDLFGIGAGARLTYQFGLEDDPHSIESAGPGVRALRASEEVRLYADSFLNFSFSTSFNGDFETGQYRFVLAGNLIDTPA